MNISVPGIVGLTENVGKPFVSNLMANIPSRFGLITGYHSNLFYPYPNKIPSIDSPDIKTYCELFIMPCAHFGVSKVTITLAGVECTYQGIGMSKLQTLSFSISTRRSTQLRELMTSDVVEAMYLSLTALTTICLTM